MLLAPSSLMSLAPKDVTGLVAVSPTCGMREPVTTTVSTVSAFAAPARVSADAVAAPSIKAARKLELFRRSMMGAPSALFIAMPARSVCC